MDLQGEEPNVPLSKIAKQRVGRLALLADKQLYSRLLGALSKQPERIQTAEEAWQAAFCDWVVQVFDAGG